MRHGMTQPAHRRYRFFLFFFAETRDRTGDLQIFSLTLSQLSYRGLVYGKKKNSII